MAEVEHEGDEPIEEVVDLRQSAWDDDDDFDSPPVEAEEEVEEVEEQEEVAEEEEVEVEKTPLQVREEELEEARRQLAADKAAKDKKEANSSKLSFDSKVIEDLKGRFDIDSLQFPHPVEEGKTMSFSEVKSEYPGIAELTESMIGMVVSDYGSKLEGVTQQMEEMKLRNDVLRAHPDADDVFVDDKFNTWVGNQSESIQTLLDYGSAKDVSLVLSEYKQTIKPPEPKKEKKPRPGQRAPSKKKSVVAPKKPNTQVFSRQSAWEDDD